MTEDEENQLLEELDDIMKLDEDEDLMEAEV